MTCVVALKANGRVIMGADSAGVGGLSLTVRRDPKIFRVGNVLIGFTTSFRMGQLLGTRLKIPDHDPRVDLYKWMCTDFIDAVRECLKKGGWAHKENEVERGGRFLVAIAGQIYTIDSDYQVGEAEDDFDAVGCGAEIALGALYASPHQEPAARVQLALQAAERFSAGVRAPFLIEVL